MAFSPKVWQDAPSISTQITAAALIDLETRLAAYTDSGLNVEQTRTKALTITPDTGTPLTLISGTSVTGLIITSRTQAIGVTQNRDNSNYSSDPADVIDIYGNQSTGDVIFAGHYGGLLPASFTFTATTTNGSPTLTSVSALVGLMKGTPLSGTGIPAGARLLSNASGTSATMDANATASGSITVTVTRPSGTSGGNAIFNGLIPQYLDALGDGRTGGTILNNRDGMKGLFIDNQVTTNTANAVLVRNYGAAAGIRVENQTTGNSQGVGRSFQIEEYNTAASPFLMNAYGALGAATGFAMIDLRAQWTGSGTTATKGNALQVVDVNSKVRAALDTTGQFVLNDGTRDRIALEPAASAGLLQFKDSTGHLRMSFDANAAQFMYNAAGNQVAAFSSTANTDGYFIFGRAGGASVIGFYGTTPVVKPTVSGAKGSNAALASLLTALSGLGLVTDSSSA